MVTIYPLLNKINDIILNPLIVLGFSMALVAFFWGLFQFVSGASVEEVRTKGKSNMMFGLLGFFIMIGVYGIIQIILNTFGIKGPAYLKLN
ncbi:MAG TPA: hypothetical protein VI981_04870 [Candidatus Paceibacterota bacterium]